MSESGADLYVSFPLSNCRTDGLQHILFLATSFFFFFWVFHFHCSTQIEQFISIQFNFIRFKSIRLRILKYASCLNAASLCKVCCTYVKFVVLAAILPCWRPRTRMDQKFKIKFRTIDFPRNWLEF